MDTKLSGFGFNVLDFDGLIWSDFRNVSISLKSDKPSCLLARTVKGKGITFMEESYLWHNRMPNQDLFNQAISELELKLWIKYFKGFFINFLDKSNTKKLSLFHLILAPNPSMNLD